MSLSLTKSQQALINQFQKGFPVCDKPYLQMAKQLGCSEEQVLSDVQQLDQLGVLSRVGPVFNHKQAGASTLAALAVPAEKLDDVAELVNQFEQVNHNYAREHSYNLWFVVTANDESSLAQTLEQIEKLTGYTVLVLPMEVAYHIDLSFHIPFNHKH